MSESQGRSLMVQGRIVWSSGKTLFTGAPKLDQNTRRPILDEKGQQIIEYAFGLAISKQDPIVAQLQSAMQEEAFSIYPSRQLPPSFAWKIKDGDGVDHNGAPFASREGYAGHLVLSCTTRLKINWFIFDKGTNQNMQVNEGIKCGDYVQVQVQIKAHAPKGQGKAGLYVNPLAVRFIGYGAEIINAPSGDSIFGQQAPAMIAGASATPIAPAASFPGQPAPSAPQPAQAWPGQAPAAPVAQPFGQPPAQQPVNNPHWGILPQGVQQQVAPQPAQAWPGQAPAAPVAQPFGQPPAQQPVNNPFGFPQ